VKGLGQDDLVGAWGHAGEVGGGGVEGGAQAELLEDPGQAQTLAGLDLEARQLDGDRLVTKVGGPCGEGLGGERLLDGGEACPGRRPAGSGRRGTTGRGTGEACARPGLPRRASGEKPGHHAL